MNEEIDVISTINPTQFINRAKVKKFALEFAQANRAQAFTRVGSSFLTRINDRVRNAIIQEVKIHPSKGKTLQ